MPSTTTNNIADNTPAIGLLPPVCGKLLAPELLFPELLLPDSSLSSLFSGCSVSIDGSLVFSFKFLIDSSNLAKALSTSSFIASFYLILLLLHLKHC